MPTLPTPENQRERRPAPGRVLRVAPMILVASGLTLLGVYAAMRAHSVLGRAQALEAFAAAQTDQAIEPVAAAAVATAEPARPERQGREARLDAPVATRSPDQSLWDRGRIAAYRKSLSAAISPPLGVLTISSVNLRVPVFEGTQELALNRGVGRIEGTAGLRARGNTGIAGHRDGFFRVLKDVSIGDTIDVQSFDGTTRYRIDEILIVEPTDVHVLDPTDEATLTLVTCYPFYFLGDAPRRYIVKAVADGP